ncbi:HAD-superfamily hydrolase, subfamily IA, variant 3 [Corchorus capsularis]|uniref:HAD-superfamily hydrolase, subfamily IA, variant 3 n=1 Tax=Corchorus capsularis TaxID=210143 RepID=A0A1R3GSX7_COCAP|nr:HAD-superfamily hydrolase, subfamily IA, variant 3 [Corchorus capsularis]
MESRFNSLLFDLDDTLYSCNIGIAEVVKKNTNDYLIEKCGFPESKATRIRDELFHSHGSTFAGLRALGYDIDVGEYLKFGYLRVRVSGEFKGLTFCSNGYSSNSGNSDKVHATKVLKRLGLEDCFDQIICFETLNPNLPNSTRPDEFPIVLKPFVEAMKIALQVSQVDPRRTLFLDDSVRNIAAGKAFDLWTCLVGKTVKTKEADYAMENVNDLGQVIPEIWVNQTDGGDERISRSISELDTMLPAATPVRA